MFRGETGLSVRKGDRCVFSENKGKLLTRRRGGRGGGRGYRKFDMPFLTVRGLVARETGLSLWNLDSAGGKGRLTPHGTA